MSVTIILQAPNTATITHTGAVSATITQSGAVSATIQQVVGQGVSVQNIVPNSVTINTGGASGGGTLDSVTSAGNTTANSIEVGSVIANGNFLINGLDSLVELRGTSVDFNIQTADAENIARIATTTGGSARFQLYNHTEGFEGAEEFKATTWEDDALVISGGIPTTTKLLVSRNPNEATLQVTGDASISGDIILTSPNDTAYRIVVGNDGTLAAIPPTSTAPSITTLPTISGTLNVGELLAATAGNVSGLPTPTQVFQWQRSDDGLTGWSDITGATGATYLLGSLDEDKYIRIKQTEENILGTATANSVSTTQIGPSIYDGILDLYGSAKAAYSLRLLARDYNGYSIKIRRDSDQALKDIGFSVNGQLDVLAIENFCGSANGYVHTWYDQTGANHDLTQSSASAQPLIYNGTAVEQENNNPAIVYSGTQYLVDSTISSYQPNNIYIVLNKLSDTTYTYDGGSTGTARNSLGDSNWIYAGASLSGAWSNPSKQTLHNALYNSTASYAYQDSLLKAEGNAGPYPLLGFTVGSRYSISSYYFGSIQEIIVWNENKINERTGIETNINDFYSIY